MIRGGEQKPSKSSQLLGQISSYLSHLPSAAATPSKAFKRPLKLSVEPSELSESLSFLEEEEDELDVGAPVDFSSRDTPRVNAASRSSRSRMHLE